MHTIYFCIHIQMSFNLKEELLKLSSTTPAFKDSDDELDHDCRSTSNLYFLLAFLNGTIFINIIFFFFFHVISNQS